MRGMLALLGACLWSSTAMAGILPDFGGKVIAKKQPSESWKQAYCPQKEPLTPLVAAAVPTPIATALGPRETIIAQKYQHLSAATNGQFYNALDRALPAVLDDLLQAQLTEGADIVFLIDHTSSMEDDIGEIRQEMHQLITRFQALKGVRVGIATFSDVKSSSKYAYRAHGLSDQYEGLGAFLQSVELLGSIEDVYGAIYKTIDTFNWRSKSKRLIVIISDEVPAEGADTNYTEDEVVAHCAKHGVHTNLYPVLVDKFSPAN